MRRTRGALPRSNLVGRGSRKVARFVWGIGKSIDVIGWVFKRAEPWSNAGPRLGASFGVIR